jgi:site-specific DNA-methyltransferase (adenine-specific)
MINKAYFGDCLIEMNKIPDKSVDLIFADLPYGTTHCKWDSIIDLEKLWKQYKRVIKDDGAICLFAQTPFDKVLGASNLEMLRYEWIWQKTRPTGHLNAKKAPMKAHENILVFYKHLPTYNYIKTHGHKRKVSTAHHKRNTPQGEIYGEYGNYTTYDSTERYPISVLQFPSDRQKLNLHSTQKPVKLCEYIIKTYTNEGEVVLDNCAGSFTIAVACDNLKRGWICMENDPHSFEVGLNRVEENRKLIGLEPFTKELK